LICWSAGLQTGGLRFLKLVERKFGAPERAGLKTNETHPLANAIFNLLSSIIAFHE